MNKFDLEIILITFNRLSFLKRTMEFIFAANSPVKELPITVLDNCSTDGTSEYLQSLSQKHKNVKIIRNQMNIGGNLNIAHAFETASHTYFWVICDDDTYNWNAWDEVEKALSQKPDLVIVNTEFTKGDISFPKMVRLLTFVPASIFRREAVLPAAIKNIYYNAENWFPQTAAVCEVINKNGKICSIKNDLVITGSQDYDPTFANKLDKALAWKSKLIFFEVGYLGSLFLIDDPKKRAEAVEHFCTNNHSFLYNMLTVCKQNIIENKNDIKNYAVIFRVCNFWQKIRFLLALIIANLRFLLLYPKYNKRRKKYFDRIENTDKIS